MEELVRPPIGAVLRHYGSEETPPAGYGWRKICCPFHDDTQPSASVNTTVDGFHCHACGITGDSWKIIMHMEGVGFGEAKRIGQTVYGVTGGNLSSPVNRGRKPYKPSWT